MEITDSLNKGEEKEFKHFKKFKEFKGYNKQALGSEDYLKT